MNPYHFNNPISALFLYFTHPIQNWKLTGNSQEKASLHYFAHSIRGYLTGNSQEILCVFQIAILTVTAAHIKTSSVRV